MRTIACDACGRAITGHEATSLTVETSAHGNRTLLDAQVSSYDLCDECARKPGIRIVIASIHEGRIAFTPICQTDDTTAGATPPTPDDNDRHGTITVTISRGRLERILRTAIAENAIDPTQDGHDTAADLTDSIWHQLTTPQTRHTHTKGETR